MIYELINPSDPVTLKADSLPVAGAVCCLLGSGKASLTYAEGEQKGNSAVPFFMFGGHDEWFVQHAGVDLETFFKNDANMAAIADCLDSVMVGDISDRQAYDHGLELLEDPAKKEEWRKRLKEGRRTSLNDFAGYAWSLASGIREKLAEEGYEGEAADDQ